jgi:hypothetical protein
LLPQLGFDQIGEVGPKSLGQAVLLEQLGAVLMRDLEHLRSLDFLPVLELILGILFPEPDRLGDNPVPFDEWLQRVYVDRDPVYFDQPRMFMPQKQWLVNESGELLVEFIGRFENLQQDFDRICQRLQVEASLGHAKPSSRGSYRDYYNAQSEALVRKIFAEDIELFGYRF